VLARKLRRRRLLIDISRCPVSAGESFKRRFLAERGGAKHRVLMNLHHRLDESGAAQAYPSRKPVIAQALEKPCKKIVRRAGRQADDAAWGAS